MKDYERIAGVIRYLNEHHTEQPDLASLAKLVNLSPYHFHRIFSEWAAITPKDFLQCLTVSHAKALLREGESVMQVAIRTGLSGPGRLHDLCVNLEAATPGEIKSGGKGWIVQYGYADSPFGPCLIGESPRGICHLSFNDTIHESEQGLSDLELLQKQWPHAQLQQNNNAAIQLARKIFNLANDTGDSPPLRALVQGSAFQIQVWRALLSIPSGTILSYSQFAKMLGKPRAARAVGSAIAQNPLGYLIPCHRVIRKTGAVGTYHWGSIRKQAMIAWETTNHHPSKNHNQE